MGVVALSCKAAVAVLLVAAGGAKLADLPGFAATVRQFWPPRFPRGWVSPVAGAIAITELALGAASLSSPQAGWLNFAVLGLSAGFVAVAAAGYYWHRGRSCHCFGALSGRGYNLAGIGRASLIALAAAVATIPAGSAFTGLGLAGRLGLLAGALLVALAASSAATAAGVLAASPAGPGEAG